MPGNGIDPEYLKAYLAGLEANKAEGLDPKFLKGYLGEGGEDDTYAAADEFEREAPVQHGPPAEGLDPRIMERYLAGEPQPGEGGYDDTYGEVQEAYNREEPAVEGLDPDYNPNEDLPDNWKLSEGAPPAIEAPESPYGGTGGSAPQTQVPQEVTTQEDAFQRAMRGPAVEPEPEPEDVIDLDAAMRGTLTEPEGEFGEFLESPEGLDADPRDPGDLGREMREMYGEPSVADELEDYAALPPVQRMIKDQEDKLALQNHLQEVRDQKEAENTAEQLRIRTNMEQVAEKSRLRTESLLASAQEISEREVDTGRWWSSRGTGQKMALMFASMASGALNPKGKNDTVSLMQDMIGQDIDAQVSDIANARAGIGIQQGLVKDLYDQGMSLEEAAETARIASYGRMAEDLAAEAVKFDPMGNHVKALHGRAQEWATKQQELIMAQHSATQQRQVQADENERKQRKELRDQQSHEADMYKKGWRWGRDPRTGEEGWRRKPSGPKRAKPTSLSDQIKADEHHMVPDGRGGWKKDPTYVAPEQTVGAHDFSTKEGRDIAQAKGAVENAEARAKTLALQHEKASEARSVPALNYDDGTTFEAISDVEAQSLRTQVGAATQAIDILDNILIRRTKVGKEFLGSPEGKAMDAEMQQMITISRDIFGTGAMDDGTVRLFNKMVTGADKDPSKHIRRFDLALKSTRAFLEEKVNLSAKGAARPGKKFKRWVAPKATGITNRESDVGDNIKIVTSPFITGADAEQNARHLNNKTISLGYIIKEQNPSRSDLKSVADFAQEQLEAGTLTDAQAIELVTPVLGAMVSKQEGYKAKTLGGAQEHHKGLNDIRRALLSGEIDVKTAVKLVGLGALGDDG